MKCWIREFNNQLNDLSYFQWTLFSWSQVHSSFTWLNWMTAINPLMGVQPSVQTLYFAHNTNTNSYSSSVPLDFYPLHLIIKQFQLSLVWIRSETSSSLQTCSLYIHFTLPKPLCWRTNTLKNCCLAIFPLFNSNFSIIE